MRRRGGQRPDPTAAGTVNRIVEIDPELSKRLAMEAYSLRVYAEVSMERSKFFEMEEEWFEAAAADFPELRELVEGDLPVEFLRLVERAGKAPCAWCRELIVAIGYMWGGRPRRYCSSRCRQAAYRSRKRARAADGAS